MHGIEFEGVDVWDAVRRFVADGLDKHCFRAARTVSWSQLAVCMEADGLLLESNLSEMTPQMFASLHVEERPPEHAALMLEMHAIRCLSVQDHIDCGAAPEAPPQDSEELRNSAVSALHREFCVAAGVEGDAGDEEAVAVLCQRDFLFICS